MRTTIRIDDELYREVKTRAAQSGRTVASVLEDAVRAGLTLPEQRKARPFTVQPLSGRGGLRPGIDLSSNSSVRDALDEGKSLDELR